MTEVTTEERGDFLKRMLDAAGVTHEIRKPPGTVLARFAYGPTPDQALPFTVSFKPGAIRFVVHRVIEGEASPETYALIDRANKSWLVARAFYEPEETAVGTALTLHAVDSPPARDLVRAAIHYLFASCEELRKGNAPVPPPADPRVRVGVEDVARLLREVGYAFEREAERIRLSFQVKGGTNFVALIRVERGNLVVTASPGEAGLWKDVDNPLVRANDINRKLMTGAVACLEGERFVYVHAAPLAWLAETDWMQRPRWAKYVFETASFACNEIAAAKDA